MKIFNNKIRIKADLGKNPITRHSNPEINPWHDEESPQDFTFSNEHPAQVRYVADDNKLDSPGTTFPKFHYDKKGNKTGIAKNWDSPSPVTKSMLNEVLYYNVGKHIFPDVVIPTVIRKHKMNTSRNVLFPHSVQRYVEPHGDFDGYMDNHYSYNPDLIKIGLLDHILKHGDRHSGNFIVDKNNRVKPIDNESIFSFFRKPETWGYVNHDLPISDEIKNKISGINPEIIKKELEKNYEIDSSNKENAIKRLINLQHHLKNTDTVGNLLKTLYY